MKDMHADVVVIGGGIVQLAEKLGHALPAFKTGAIRNLCAGPLDLAPFRFDRFNDTGDPAFGLTLHG